MSRRFHTILAVTLCLLPLIPSSAQTEQQKQTMSVLKAASERLMRGDIAALDEVKALPGDDAVAGLLMFFKQNFYVYSKETQKKAIAMQRWEPVCVRTFVAGADRWIQSVTSLPKNASSWQCGWCHL
jgi:hypothetical protein